MRKEFKAGRVESADVHAKTSWSKPVLIRLDAHEAEAFTGSRSDGSFTTS